MNIYIICNVLGKMKLFMFRKICVGVQNLISLRKVYYYSIDLDYWLKHLTHSYWTYFPSGNTSCFYLKDGEKKYLSPITFYLFLKNIFLLYHWFILFLGKLFNNSQTWILVIIFSFWFNMSKKHFLKTGLKLYRDSLEIHQHWI